MVRKQKAAGLWIILQMGSVVLLMISPAFFYSDFKQVASPSGVLEKSLARVKSAPAKKVSQIGEIEGNRESNFLSEVLLMDLKDPWSDRRVTQRLVRLEFFGRRNLKSEDIVLERELKNAPPELLMIHRNDLEGGKNSRNPSRLSTGFIDLDTGVNSFKLFFKSKNPSSRELATPKSHSFRIEWVE